jgi:hypothetical protein
MVTTRSPSATKARARMSVGLSFILTRQDLSVLAVAIPLEL